uniref:Uncharacterized protein n=1 Tax=Lactuca sativa TaxID=4236 RepID=A0A9R1XJR0_LACSA|nr:hypothetical protein LSAT_V11C300138820 [Lactuca sativa]
MFLLTPGKETKDVSSATPTPTPATTPSATQQPGVNVGNEVKKGKGEVTPEHTKLLRLEEQARQQGVGLWDRSPGAMEVAIRNLPPYAFGDLSNLDAMGLLASNKGKPMEAILEKFRDGGSLRVYLLPEFHFVLVFVARIQVPHASFSANIFFK